MIWIEKPLFKDDNWCKCCNKESGSVMEIKFSVKNNTNVATTVSLCKKCRQELLMKLKDKVG